jgi:ketosteroid isomerase-like protein
MKRLFLVFVLLLFSSAVPLHAQDDDHGHDDDHDHAAMSDADRSGMNDAEAVKGVLRRYKEALENLNVSGTRRLFAEGADIFENGSYEGTYQEYLDGHIGPELGHFEEFSFDDYAVDVRMEGNLAVVHETYTYRIVTGGSDSRTIERRGVATSVLKKMNGAWKIIQNHGSSRPVQ